MRALFNPLFVGLLITLWSVPGWTERVDLYRAEVPVADQSDAARRAALGQALAQVLVRVSGQQSVTAEPGVAAALRQAEQMLVSFQYRSSMEINPETSQPQREFRLVADFDPGAVQNLVREYQLPSWGAERPAVVVWLFVEDQRLLSMFTDATDPRLRALRTRASERGIPLVFPLMDLEDQSRVDMHSVWRGAEGGIQRANARYGTPLALVGRLSLEARSPAQWSLLGDNVSDAWTASGDWEPQLRAGIDGLAERLGQRYAILPGEQTLTSVRLVVDGIHSAADYARLTGYLSGLSVVAEVIPEQASAQRLNLRLNLLAGAGRLRQQIAMGHVLAPAGPGAQPGGEHHFQLLP